jgi:hypothetical protein
VAVMEAMDLAVILRDLVAEFLTAITKKRKSK